MWDEAKEAYIDCIRDDGTPSPKVSQQTNSLAILCGVAADERLEKIRNVPVEAKDGMTKVGSPFALFYILEALVKQGRFDGVLSVTRERWGEMIKLGATTFWEMFPGFWGDWWTRSYCHAWSAAPVYFLSRYNLGVWWDEPGYKKARIAPIPLDLTWAKGRVPTPTGEISAAWEKKDDSFTLEVALPAGTRAVVELPVNAAEFPKIEAKGFKAEKRGDTWTLELPAGAKGVITAKR